MGLFNLEVGNPFEVLSGSFETILWGADSYFLRLEFDPTGGTSFQLMGTSQLLSVPYALNSSSVALTSPNGTTFEVTVDDAGNLATNCIPDPSQADAGVDQIDVTGTNATLQGNTPVYGSGTWGIITGVGGNITELENPSSTFTGLIDETYKLEWAISNACGIASDTVNINFVWNCGYPITDSRDGKIYSTVQIGTQCWMAQNLNIGIMIAGTISQTNNGTIEKYCYNNLESNCDVYGGLYQWDEMMQYTTEAGALGICPVGWHLPTTNEWHILTEYISSQPQYFCNENPNNNAKALASNTNWYTQTSVGCAVGNNLAANNATGFGVMAGGYFASSAFWQHLANGVIWSSSQKVVENNAWLIQLNWEKAFVGYYDTAKSSGFSVRCHKDN